MTTEDVSPENLPIETDFTRVDSFRRQANFVVKDERLCTLDVTKPGGKDKMICLFDGLGGLNSQVAVTHDGAKAVVSDGRRIWSVDVSGYTQELANLDTLRVSKGKVDLAKAEINWHLSISKSEKKVFCVLLGNEEPLFSSVACIDVAKAEIQVMDVGFPHGISVDGDRGIVYNMRGIKSFDGSVDKEIWSSIALTNSDFSPDMKYMLVSMEAQDEDKVVTILDLETHREERLPIDGWYAVWGGNDHIYFRKVDNSLWRYDLETGEQRPIFAVGKDLTIGNCSSYGTAPVLSKDRSFLAWNFMAVANVGGFVWGTVLVDLENVEYRVVDGSWYNFNWMKRRDRHDVIQLDPSQVVKREA